jgi:hypothetical protein
VVSSNSTAQAAASTRTQRGIKVTRSNLSLRASTQWLRIAIFLAIVASATGYAVAPAGAASETYLSNSWLSTHFDSNCWYGSGEACSSPYAFTNISSNGVQYGTTVNQVLQGFESSSAIRGRIFYPNVSGYYLVYPADYFSTGPLRGNVVAWFGDSYVQAGYLFHG